MFDLLPANFAGWFRLRGWTPRDHQIAMVAAARAGASVLLIAPTGAGKTLAGFLPTLIELSERPREGLHTLYVSPLKALAVDVARNLETPIAELRLPIRAETRTGDTPEAKRKRQRAHPPQILMTTPESLALLLSYTDAGRLFAPLRRVVIDELHALVDGKRGDQLALGLARLAKLAPEAARVGLSATVADPGRLRAWLSRTGLDDGSVTTVVGRAGAAPEVELLNSEERVPWGGHMGWYAVPEILDRVARHRTTLIFVNTRAQAELIFQELWKFNTESLPIAIHHGSLSPEQRRKVEAAMARGDLRAVVATSSLDLGVDWAAVDLVVQLGAPKGASRLVQRIGRANHRLDEPSRALLIPTNRLEVLECRAAVDAVREMDLDAEPPRPGGTDVLAQHMLGVACSAPFDADALYEEVVRAAPYADLPRDEFDDVLDFVETGGYALSAYERYRRLKRTEDGRYVVASPKIARSWRLNSGTIVAEPMTRVRLRNGRVLGEIEEYFIQGLVPGDTFVLGGELLRFIGVRETEAICERGGTGDPAVPVYAGGRLPLTTRLAERVRALLDNPAEWDSLPGNVREWLEAQRLRSRLPPRDGLLVETFPREGKRWLVAYPFEGRNAHQTLGMLLTRRMERMGTAPLGFVATDHIVAVWSLRTPVDIDGLFARDMLGDDLEEWMAESSLMKRTFRNVAIISGVIERRRPGEEKTKRQVTVSSDLIYDTLRRHDPGHVLLRATRADAAGGLTDVGRLGDFLKRVERRIVHMDLDRISPLAVPAILAVGRERVAGSADDELLEALARDLAHDAMPGDSSRAVKPPR